MNVYPKPEGQKMELVRVTPDLAKQWLATTASNFRLRGEGHLDRLCKKIAERGWWSNGSTFKFNRHGEMIDGQHRATVIVKLGITVWAWVLTGLSVDASEQQDTEMSLRSTVQRLRKLGKPYYSQLAGAIYYFNAWVRHSLRHPHNVRPTIEESMSILSNNPGLEASASRAALSTLGLAGPLGALHYIATSKGHGVAADKFVSLFVTGADLSQNDPILLLRMRLTADKSSKSKLQADNKIALLLSAWNAWSQGRSLKQLKWSSVGPTAQEFPEIEFPMSED